MSSAVRDDSLKPKESFKSVKDDIFAAMDTNSKDYSSLVKGLKPVNPGLLTTPKMKNQVSVNSNQRKL